MQHGTAVIYDEGTRHPFRAKRESGRCWGAFELHGVALRKGPLLHSLANVCYHTTKAPVHRGLAP